VFASDESVALDLAAGAPQDPAALLHGSKVK
jgi:hypothetical protein